MSKVKQSMIILSLFALLLAVVFAPMLWIEYQNNKMLNELHISSVKRSHLDSPSSIKEGYNIWERIGIINTSVVVRSTVSTESKTKLREELEKQIAAICRYKAIPDISLTGVTHVSIIKETYMDNPTSGGYMDILNSDRVLNVWEIIVEYENYVVCAYMDTVTNAVYELTIVTKDTDLLYQPEISDTGFIEYLKTFSDVPADLGMAFSAKSYYSSGKLCLSLCSMDKNAKLTIYRFNNTAVTYAYPMYKVADSDDKSPASETNPDGR